MYLLSVHDIEFAISHNCDITSAEPAIVKRILRGFGVVEVPLGDKRASYQYFAGVAWLDIIVFIVNYPISK